MSWMESLCKTYDNNISKVGIKDNDGTILLPVCHTSQSAQIECKITMKGELFSARVLDKAEAMTIIPCTIDSVSRTSGLIAHPLFDKLKYIAKDYDSYNEKSKKDSAYHLYYKEISDWCNSKYPHPYVKVLMEYLEKGTLISDLIRQKIIHVDTDGNLLKKWNSAEEKPLLFKVLNGDQGDAFLRFSILDDDTSHNIWEEKDVQQSFINYYLGTQKDVGFDFVTGEVVPCVSKNPSKVRNSADMAKLISSNDSQGFTYRGKFAKPDEAASIGYMSSQKAHNALKWLIEKQGKQFGKGELSVVAWGDKALVEINMLEDHLSNQKKLGLGRLQNNTYEDYAKKLRKAISGYLSKDFVFENDLITIMAVDSASKGRLSIVYYQNLTMSNYMLRLQKWYETCSWDHLIVFDEEGKKVKRSYYQGSPSPMDIIKAAYGEHVKENLVKQTVKRILRCIIEGKSIPVDIVRRISNRLCHPASMDTLDYDIALNVGCAIIRKSLIDRNKKEGIHMGLDKTCNDRDYLFGRLLAFMDRVESLGNYLSNDKDKTVFDRTTNAKRYMKRYQMEPMKTLFYLFDHNTIYMQKLKGRRSSFETEINDLLARLNLTEVKQNQPLSESFLLGYGAQMNEFYIETAKRYADKEREEK